MFARFNPCQPCCQKDGCHFQITATLDWSGGADLDLYVTRQNKPTLYYGNTSCDFTGFACRTFGAVSGDPSVPEVVSITDCRGATYAVYYAQRTTAQPQATPTKREVRFANIGSEYLYVYTTEGVREVPPSSSTTFVDNMAYLGYGVGDVHNSYPATTYNQAGGYGITCNWPETTLWVFYPDAIRPDECYECLNAWIGFSTDIRVFWRGEYGKWIGGNIPGSYIQINHDGNATIDCYNNAGVITGTSSYAPPVPVELPIIDPYVDYGIHTNLTGFCGCFETIKHRVILGNVLAHGDSRPYCLPGHWHEVLGYTSTPYIGGVAGVTSEGIMEYQGDFTWSGGGMTLQSARGANAVAGVWAVSPNAPDGNYMVLSFGGGWFVQDVLPGTSMYEYRVGSVGGGHWQFTNNPNGFLPVAANNGAFVPVDNWTVVSIGGANITPENITYTFSDVVNAWPDWPWTGMLNCLNGRAVTLTRVAEPLSGWLATHQATFLCGSCEVVLEANANVVTSSPWTMPPPWGYTAPTLYIYIKDNSDQYRRIASGATALDGCQSIRPAIVANLTFELEASTAWLADIFPAGCSGLYDQFPHKLTGNLLITE